MNLSHVIDEFSFGPHFPDITQPLDYSVEIAHDRTLIPCSLIAQNFHTLPSAFVAYQYFLHVVPTTYVAPRSKPLDTNQYSVTHYTRILQHNRGTPGIFFKFDLDPMSLTIHQRTTSFLQLFIRCDIFFLSSLRKLIILFCSCVGVLGGLFVCTSYAIRITTKAVEMVSGSDPSQGIVAAEATGVKIGRGLRSKWAGSELRSRISGNLARQTGWATEGSGYGSDGYSSNAGTPMSNGFLTPGLSAQSPFVVNSPVPSASPGVGLGIPSSAFGSTNSGFPSSPLTPYAMRGRSVSPGAVVAPQPPNTSRLSPSPGPGPSSSGLQSVPGTPGLYATFPASPNGQSVTVGPPPRRGPQAPKKDD